MVKEGTPAVEVLGDLYHHPGGVSGESRDRELTHKWGSVVLQYRSSDCIFLRDPGKRLDISYIEVLVPIIEREGDEDVLIIDPCIDAGIVDLRRHLQHPIDDQEVTSQEILRDTEVELAVSGAEEVK